MSRIFLSHSSTNNAEAGAVRDWMAKQGWEDVFLDLDPDRGLKAGQRWQDALKQAAERCEMVIFLISPAWAASKWCLAEFLLAKNLNKRIFAAIVQPTSFDAMPVEMTAEWQVVDLTAGPRDYKATVTLPPGNATTQVEFGSDGLHRLRTGLKEAGSIPVILPGRRRTIPIVRPTRACARWKRKTPGYSSGGRRRPSSRSIACAVCAKPRRRDCW